MTSDEVLSISKRSREVPAVEHRPDSSGADRLDDSAADRHDAEDVVLEFALRSGSALPEREAGVTRDPISVRSRGGRDKSVELDSSVVDLPFGILFAHDRDFCDASMWRAVVRAGGGLVVSFCGSVRIDKLVLLAVHQAAAANYGIHVLCIFDEPDSDGLQWRHFDPYGLPSGTGTLMVGRPVEISFSSGDLDEARDTYFVMRERFPELHSSNERVSHVEH